MSLFGALRTGVSGLGAQSSAMSIISDNIANVNTVGYKSSSATFSTLVTKQVSSSQYTSGGVHCRTRAGVDIQGLLSSTSYSTDLGIAGNGFFVTTQTSKPDVEDLWSYTRVGNFSIDSEGYLRNDNGYYLQAWPLLAFDGEENASIVQIGEDLYMKAYTNEVGTKIYVNDNVIDQKNLRAINLNTIGGTAQETNKISFGANLPADAPVFNPDAPEDGGRYSSSILIYDSLGNSHNATMSFTKTEPGCWSMDIAMSTGYTTLVTYASTEATNDRDQDVYSARAQLEFISIPTNHSTVAMETNGTNYVFEFVTDNAPSYSPGPNEVVIPVDLSAGIVSVADAVNKLNTEIQKYMPSAARFSVGTDGTTLEVQQSTAGAAVHFKVNTTSCLQSAANPDPVSGVASGEFDLPEIDWDIKNSTRIEFGSDNMASYMGKSVTLGNHSYVFSDTDHKTENGVVTVNIASLLNRATGKVNPKELVSLLKQSINANEPDFERYVASGTTLEINPTSTGANILVNSGDSSSVTFQSTNIAAYVYQYVKIGDLEYEFRDNPGIKSGTVLTNGRIAVNISDLKGKDKTEAAPIALMNALYNTMKAYYEDHPTLEDISSYMQVNGATMVSAAGYLDSPQCTTPPNIDHTEATLNEDTLSFAGLDDVTDYNTKSVTINDTIYNFQRSSNPGAVFTATTIDLDQLIDSQTLTFSKAPAVNDAVTISNVTYTFKSKGGTDPIDTVNHEIDLDALGLLPESGGGLTDDEIAANKAANAATAMTALGNAFGLSPSVSGAKLELGAYQQDPKITNVTSTSGATLEEAVDELVMMNKLAELANVTPNGSSLTLRAYNAHAIASTDFAVGTAPFTETLQQLVNTTGIGNSVLDVHGKDNGRQFDPEDTDGLLVVTNTFAYNNVAGAQSGSIIPGTRFNADGTPKQINTDKIAIEWANGAKDMTGQYYESSQIDLYLGDNNTANGLTQLAGNYTTNFVHQDGAKYGNYTGVSVGTDGIVTAIFDNGETRAIAQIPIATFVDVNSLEVMTGNAYIETTGSGTAILRTAGESGAGTIASSSLEQSTVDIAQEFTNMITTQRAYSAASKIITTADSMLEELLTIKR